MKISFNFKNSKSSQIRCIYMCKYWLTLQNNVENKLVHYYAKYMWKDVICYSKDP
jgi:hypothetical protein